MRQMWPKNISNDPRTPRTEFLLIISKHANDSRLDVKSNTFTEGCLRLKNCGTQ